MKSRILVGSLALGLMVGSMAGCNSGDAPTGSTPSTDAGSTAATTDTANVTKVTFSVPGMT